MKKLKIDQIAVIDIIIIILSIVTGFYIYININNIFMRNITLVVLGVIVLSETIKIIKNKLNKIFQEKNIIQIKDINNICLLNDEDKVIQEWDLFNKTSMVLGRNTKSNEVNIDLSMSKYASLIDPQHAVLNFATDIWYVEDLYSKNGIRIQKSGDQTKYKVSKDKACAIAKGDLLYIANTRLLLQ